MLLLSILHAAAGCLNYPSYSENADSATERWNEDAVMMNGTDAAEVN